MAASILVGRWRQSSLAEAPDFGKEMRRARGFERWFQTRRTDKRHYGEFSLADIEALKAQFPELAARHVEAAKRVLDHSFDLLGSGPYQPHSHGSLKDVTLGYRPINWAFDPVRGVTFRNDVPHREWRLFEMRPENADIKYPWELARCQHFAPLSQAWVLTRDPRYALEIIDQIADFTEANPVATGVNWTCTMDVALRAASWAHALALIKDCEAVPLVRRETAYRALFDHGVFIFANLENTYEITSNHYLTNVVGLHALAGEFIDTAAGRNWDAFCRISLEEEIEIQVLADGADFESSVPYHRLVAELFMGSYRLAQIQGRPLSAQYANRLAAMADYLAGVMRPDGLMPQFGDADDGRLHIFTDYGSWQRQDGRHLFEPISRILDVPRFASLGGQEGLWEAFWWGFGGVVRERSAELRCPSDHVMLFPQAGAFVARFGGHYLLVTNSIVGTKGFGNHKHNEQLSYEYHAFGKALIVDPGSYVYTSDFDARNAFRSVAMHSTVMIDGEEQNETRPDWLFRMFEKAEPEHIAHGQDGDTVFYEGLHRGYERFECPVTHQRRFELDRQSGVLTIQDLLTGKGIHGARWNFQLAPGVTANQVGNMVLLDAPGVSCALALPEKWKASFVESWYSPSYGVRLPACAIALEAKVDLAQPFAVTFTLTPRIGA